MFGDEPAGKSYFHQIRNEVKVEKKKKINKFKVIHRGNVFILRDFLTLHGQKGFS